MKPLLLLALILVATALDADSTLYIDRTTIDVHQGSEGISRRPARVAVESYEPLGNPRHEAYAGPPPVYTPEWNDQYILMKMPKKDFHQRSTEMFYRVATGNLCFFSKEAVAWGWSDSDYYYVRICRWSSRTNKVEGRD